MNGPIAQIVALTCYGNAFLAGEPAERFFSANSTCQFCESVTFATLNKNIFGKVKEVEIASSPEAFFANLKSRGARGIRLSQAQQNNSRIADRLSAGFVGGGGTWTMEVLFPRELSEFWIARWEVGNQNAPDRRIWRVTYGRLSQGKSKPSAAGELTPAIQELEQSLQDIRTFSERQKLDAFTKSFAEALDTIATQGAARHGYHQDLAPPGFLSDQAAMLLDACQSAWVFGGMGSWSDLGFAGEDQKTYERVSDRLFQAVNSAIAAAATSTRKEESTVGARIP